MLLSTVQRVALCADQLCRTECCIVLLQIVFLVSPGLVCIARIWFHELSGKVDTMLAV